jgi:hypothetical protein
VKWDHILERKLRAQREEEMAMECANVTNGGHTATPHAAPAGGTFVGAGGF